MPKPLKPSSKDDQIRGQIASLESELGKLVKDHDAMTAQFHEKAGANLKRHAELTGGIAALKALLPQ